jgi:hypothetical protein|tara:strand:+ start:452 stop:880 length:429 start_codon:yes stop_codon:yes gene_type:complete
MENEFYASIKLVSGEELFSLVSIEDNTDNPLILCDKPVTMKMVNTPDGSIVKVRTWMNIPGDDPVVIQWDKVITVTEIKENGIIAIYNNYLEDERFDISQLGECRNDVKGQLTPKMGYISTVDDARKYLEDIFSSTEDKKES